MKYSDKPMFSILIPLNQSEDQLAFSIDSVLSQSYRNFELLLLDRQNKASERCDLLKVLDRTTEQGIVLRVVGVEDGLKGGAAKNRGIQQAKGDLIAFLKPGDRWEPHYLEEVVMLRDAFTEAEAYATSYQWHVDGEHFIDPKIHLTSCAARPSLLNEYFDSAVKGGQPFVLSSFVGSKQLFEKVGLFNVTEEAGHEHDLFCRAALYSAIAYSPSVLSFAKNDHEDTLSLSFVANEWSAFVSRVKSYAARETEVARRRSVSRYAGAFMLELASLSVTKRRADVAKFFLADECCKQLLLRYIWCRFRCWIGSRGGVN